LASYSSNLTGAIATLLTTLLWGITALGTELGWCLIGRQPVTTLAWALIPYWIGAWILLPLYVKKVKWSFLVGIIYIIVAIVGITAMPSALPWYTFVTPVYSASYIVFCIIGLALIYFSYTSYKEL
jgi:hypothetical protein